MPPPHRPLPQSQTQITKFVNNLQLLPRSQHKLSYSIHHLHPTPRTVFALEVPHLRFLRKPAHHPTTSLVNPLLARCAPYSITTHPCLQIPHGYLPEFST